jgi:hypothetical protein
MEILCYAYYFTNSHDMTRNYVTLHGYNCVTWRPVTPFQG